MQQSSGGSGVQERSRSSTCKPEEHSQQGFVKNGNNLGGSRGGSSKQIRMASKCGPMHPFGCGLNQGQGQSSGSRECAKCKINLISVVKDAIVTCKNQVGKTHHFHFADRTDVVDVNVNEHFQWNAYETKCRQTKLSNSHCTEWLYNAQLDKM